MSASKLFLPHEHKTDIAAYGFATSREAWAFMNRCDGLLVDGVAMFAGFPSLRPEVLLDGVGLYTVRVSIATLNQRAAVDEVAAGAPCVGYWFAGSRVPGVETQAQEGDAP